MADSIYTFDPTASNNTSLDGIPYGPNQLYHNKIDDWFRAVAAKLAQLVDDIGGVNTVGGTANAITVTLASGIAAYATGQIFSFKAASSNTAAVTINVNSIGAKAIRKIVGGTDVALAANDILAGVRYGLVYDSAANSSAGAFIIVSSTAALALTAKGRNRIVNGDMRASQENGATSGTSNGYYAVDQFATYRVTSAGTITSAQVASVTPAGSPNRYRVTITVADASLAAGEYLTITQNLEGSNVADFQYGGSSAKYSVLRFGFKGPAGTYAARLGNSAANRSYVALFTIGAGEANTDTVQTFSIPGDTTGTWLTADGVIGITLDIVLACGSTFQGTTGWQAGNILGTSAVTNGMGTVSSVFELFDVGLKLDPDATGVYGAYEVGYTDAVYRSERYYEKILYASNTSVTVGACISSADVSWSFVYSPKCKAPAVPLPPATIVPLTATNSPTSVSVNTIAATGIQQARIVTTITSASLVAGNASSIYANGVSSLIANARLS